MRKRPTNTRAKAHVNDFPTGRVTHSGSLGRTPKATNISTFYDSANGSRDPGQWPSLLRRSWELRHGQTQPYPYGPDNMQSRGARASQYSS